MATNTDFLGCNEERKEKSFFKIVNIVNISSEQTRAIPHDFAKCFSDDVLLGTMVMRVPCGRTWGVKVTKNPIFYIMEKSGWETFVKDNALGKNEFLTFTHKGRMHFSVNIMNQSGKEILQPPQTSTFSASSRQDVKTEEVAVSAGLSPRGARTEAESSGRGGYKRKLNFENKKAEGSQSSKRAETERVVSNPRDNAGPSSFSGGRGVYERKLNFGDKKAEGSQSSKRAETERVVSNPRDNAGPSSFSGGRGVYERKLNFGDKKAEGSQSSKRAETERVVSKPRDNAGPSSFSGGRGVYERKLNLGDKKAEGSQNSKRAETERVVSNPRDNAGPSSFSGGRGVNERKLNFGNKKAEGSQSSKRAETERVVSNPRDNAGPSSVSGGRGVYERKLNFGDKKAEGSQSSKRAETERVVSNPRDNAGPSSVSGASFNVFIRQSYLKLLSIPRSHVRNYMPKETTLFKINHPDGKRSWNVYYVVGSGAFSSGWNILCWEYPVVAGDTCKFTFVNPHELILVVSKS